MTDEMIDRKSPIGLPSAFDGIGFDVERRSSEDEFHAELHLSRRADGAANRPEILAQQVRIRLAVRRMIQHVEDLAPHLKPFLLADADALHQAGIDVGKRGPLERVARKVAEA